jgi:hypothetical protein
MTRENGANERLECIQSFMRSYHCFFVMAKSRDSLDMRFGSLYPYTHLSNTLLYDTVSSWCKIFGANTEANHWKNLITDHDGFRERLFSCLSISHDQYTSYHEELVNFRNGYVSHFDAKRGITRVPKLEIAHDSVVILNDFILGMPEFLGALRQPSPIASYGVAVARALATGLGVEYVAPPTSL